jgi:DNA-binding transcriptional LysR family regulator
MIDLYKLSIFMRVARAGSFTAAAVGLHMTQSGVSQHIGDLEAYFGARLFARTSRGVTLTPAGTLLLGYAERLLQLAAEAEDAVTDLEQAAGGQVTIAATPGVSVYLLPEWVASFRTRYPRFTLSLHTDITPHIIAGLRDGRYDLAVVEGEVSDAGVTLVELQTVEQQVVIGRAHPWWGRASVPIAALDGQTFIMRQPTSQTRRWLDHMLAQHDVHPRIMAEFDNLESIKRAVSAGSCLSILPPYTIEHERTLGLLQAVSIEGAPLVRTIRLMHLTSGRLSSAARAFMRHVTGAFAKPA